MGEEYAKEGTDLAYPGLWHRSWGGFRPTVSRHAAASGIRGTVCNKGPYVEIYTQVKKEQTKDF